MYFYPQSDFINTRVFLPPDLQYQPNKKMAISFSMVGQDRPAKRTKNKPKQDQCSPLGTDVKPSEASETKIQLPVLDDVEPPAKRLREKIDLEK
ncbi:uncharacterized protein LOC116159824 isoform X2 [Photinus pyralis]|uniref:uncharacterized protein LOC116159804 isoform X2 n=1 Tax=Photinus pyralis TaxID=7054 RepID=UPI001266E937|nr:uncharacterized protein LOC116159804 isoform X2 [Photinus pyralis]XP_031328768.1 uncharacterized protein LOC116159824 isoform X2 [Photinus pyralis]